MSSEGLPEVWNLDAYCLLQSLKFCVMSDASEEYRSGRIACVASARNREKERMSTTSRVSWQEKAECPLFLRSGHTKWMESHKEQTIGFLMAMVKAMRFLNEPKNKEASIQAMIKHFKINWKYAEMAYKEVVEELRPLRNDGAPSIKGIDTVINLQVENKGLDKPYPAATFIEDAYRQQALKRLGG